jgi:hypothetical protein
MASALPPFPPFNVDDDVTTTGQRWDKWTKRFNNFFVAMNITDATRKRALLLHYIGRSAFDIFETLTDTGDAKAYDKAIDRLTEHFTPQRNIDHETYLFRQARQLPTETLDQFATRLRQLASTREFDSIDKEIKSQIVLSCSSSRLRRRALHESSLTLKSLLGLGRAMEISEKQTSGIESQTAAPFDTEELNYTRASLPSRSSSGNFSSSQQYPRLTSTCGHCGNTYPHPQGQDSCRARGCQCRSCVKINHFSRCCRSKPQNHSVDQHRSPRQQQRNELSPPPPHLRA